MRLDLDDFGIDVESTGRSTYKLDPQRLVAGVERVSKAVDELHAAWEALPPAVRKRLGKVVLTMQDDDGEDDRA